MAGKYVQSKAPPPLPVLVDAKEDNTGGDAEEVEKSNRASPSQRSAAYAKLNRERRKKYIAELEKYQVTMTERLRDTQQELDDIRTETLALQQELSVLRSDLYRNVNLMSVLTKKRATRL